MRILTLTTVAVAAAALAAGTATATGTKGSPAHFKTQNGRIYCLATTGGAGRAFVYCGIKNGHLKPRPKANCHGDDDPTGGWPNLNARGRTRIQTCSGDPGPLAGPAKVLAPGKTWSGGGISCKATASAMTCRNKAQHGFTITTAGPYKKF